MKKLILIASLFVTTISAKSQDFGGFEHILDMPPDSLLASKYLFNNPKGAIYEHLYDIHARLNGGLVITYQRLYSDTLHLSPSYSIYFYSKNNKCDEIRLISSLDENGEQIKNMLTDFYIINDHTLFAKNENLKMTHYNDVKNNQTYFIYTRKKNLVY